MKLLRVDMNEMGVKWESVPAAYEHLGGRGLIAKLLLTEMPPCCEALGPHNKLVVAPGLLGGSGVAASGRLSVGGNSPLTGGVKEANSGGTAGDALGKLEIKAIVVEGHSAGREPKILHVTHDSAQLIPGGALKGQGTYATSDRLREQYGDGCTVISIGQAGELLLTGAGVVCTGEGDNAAITLRAAGWAQSWAAKGSKRS